MRSSLVWVLSMVNFSSFKMIFCMIYSFFIFIDVRVLVYLLSSYFMNT